MHLTFGFLPFTDMRNDAVAGRDVYDVENTKYSDP